MYIYRRHKLNFAKIYTYTDKSTLKHRHLKPNVIKLFQFVSTPHFYTTFSCNFSGFFPTQKLRLYSFCTCFEPTHILSHAFIYQLSNFFFAYFYYTTLHHSVKWMKLHCLLGEKHAGKLCCICVTLLC